MSIKGWIGIGAGALTLIGTIFGVRKRRIQSNERIEQIIRSVDLKENTTEAEETTVKDIVEDVDQAVLEMELDELVEKVHHEMTDTEEELEEIKKAKRIKKQCDDILEETKQDFKKDFPEEVNGIEDLVDDSVQKAVKTEEELEEIRQKEKERKEKDWLQRVNKAVERKNYFELEDILNEKYNPYPYHPAPYGPYGQAKNEGVITEEFYKEAEKHYGKMWCYSGD